MHHLKCSLFVVSFRHYPVYQCPTGLFFSQLGREYRNRHCGYKVTLLEETHGDQTSDVVMFVRASFIWHEGFKTSDVRTQRYWM